LWRLEVIQHALTDDLTWKDLAEQGEWLLHQQADYLTVWMHHWIGLALARAGKTAQAQQQMARLRSLPEGKARGYWAIRGAVSWKARWRSYVATCSPPFGHTDIVTELAQRRLLSNRNHLQSLAALAWVYQRTGQATLQRHACRQLIARASELGLALQTPDLRDAQQVLQVLT
jgi:hypothetical protein